MTYYTLLFSNLPILIVFRTLNYPLLDSASFVPRLYLGFVCGYIGLIALRLVSCSLVVERLSQS